MDQLTIQERCTLQTQFLTTLQVSLASAIQFAPKEVTLASSWRRTKIATLPPLVKSHSVRSRARSHFREAPISRDPPVSTPTISVTWLALSNNWMGVSHGRSQSSFTCRASASARACLNSSFSRTRE